LEKKVPWFTAAAIGVQEFDVNSLCALNPSQPPAFTLADFLAAGVGTVSILGGSLNPSPPRVFLDKVLAWLQFAAFETFCQCNPISPAQACGTITQLTHFPSDYSPETSFSEFMWPGAWWVGNNVAYQFQYDPNCWPNAWAMDNVGGAGGPQYTVWDSTNTQVLAGGAWDALPSHHSLPDMRTTGGTHGYTFGMGFQSYTAAFPASFNLYFFSGQTQTVQVIPVPQPTTIIVNLPTPPTLACDSTTLCQLANEEINLLRQIQQGITILLEQTGPVAYVLGTPVTLSGSGVVSTPGIIGGLFVIPTLPPNVSVFGAAPSILYDAGWIRFGDQHGWQPHHTLTTTPLLLMAQLSTASQIAYNVSENVTFTPLTPYFG
ncbi:MAG: hypothetical protein HRJ53_07785, partial [Acidobacteria bacterium Pan2503]|nr:hypothetical protein [Candidatus Acidoferrum panamensis]